MLLFIIVYSSTNIFFDKLINISETNEFQEEFNRVQYVITENIDNLNTLTLDYSAWDDTLYFVKNSNIDYIQDNITIKAIDNLKINFGVYFDNNNNLKYSFYLNPKTNTLEPLNDNFKNYLIKRSDFFL